MTPDQKKSNQLARLKIKLENHIMIQLEIHSGNTIPAVDWFKLQELEKEYLIRTDSGLRERERKHVKSVY